MHAFLLDGREAEVTVPVHASRDMKFTALAKRTETRTVICHHTGGVRGVAGVYETLQERGLSVHFVIESDGKIWQLADAAYRCSHAGTANSFSVGIEIVNPARAKKLPKDVDREIVLEEIHGIEAKATTFTVPQVQSALALTHALCRAFGLPHRVPERDGKLVAEILTAEEGRTFRGVSGHFHWKGTKRDPGTLLLNAIKALPCRREGNGSMVPGPNQEEA